MRKIIMKTILKIFITLIIAIPFNRAFANCTNTLSIFEKYCDNEGYYKDNKPGSAPSYGEIVQNCEQNKIIFTCYKFKDKYNKNKNKLEEELQKCCDKKNTTITIKSATRPDGHIHRESDIKEAEKEKLNQLKDLCKKTKSDDGRWQPLRKSCDCGDDKNWDTSQGCVLKSEQERKEKCKTENFPGATNATWDDQEKKCTITCDTSTHKPNEQNNGCDSNAYIQADKELSDLINQAYTRLTELETANEEKAQQ